MYCNQLNISDIETESIWSLCSTSSLGKAIPDCDTLCSLPCGGPQKHLRRNYLCKNTAVQSDPGSLRFCNSLLRRRPRPLHRTQAPCLVTPCETLLLLALCSMTSTTPFLTRRRGGTEAHPPHKTKPKIAGRLRLIRTQGHNNKHAHNGIRLGHGAKSVIRCTHSPVNDEEPKIFLQ